MTALLRFPLVVYGYLVDQLRRRPLADRVLRHTSLVAAVLMVGAFVALLADAAQGSPDLAPRPTRSQHGDLLQKE